MTNKKITSLFLVVTFVFISGFGFTGLIGFGAHTSFSPRDIPDLLAWYDAGAGITLNGSDVSDWADQSANGNDAAQSTATDQPAYNTTAFNGHPSLIFDGADDFLQAPDSADYDDVTTGLTVFLAGKVLTSTAVREIVNTSDSNNTWRWRVLADETMQLFLNDGGIERMESTTLVTESQDSVWASTFIAGGNTDFFEDGTDIGTEVNTITSLNTTAEHLNIGKGYGTLSEFWNGEMAEIIIYSRALSDPEVNQVGNYLADKYGLTWTDI